jgi:hypothetical protein
MFSLLVQVVFAMMDQKEDQLFPKPLVLPDRVPSDLNGGDRMLKSVDP